MTANPLRLHPKLLEFAPDLIIFDKDGTLINFHAMWGTWAKQLAHKLEDHSGQPVAEALFKAWDFDPLSGKIIPGGHLADSPLAELRQVTMTCLEKAGCSAPQINSAMATAWQPPDPLALAQPLADLPTLFSTIRAYRAKIAIATSDDHQPTETLLTAWQLAPLVDSLICADDGLPIKPAPDMILTVCQQLNISPAKSVMVGDNVADLLMGQAAGVGLKIGLLSGISTRADIKDEADMILNSVAELIINSE